MGARPLVAGNAKSKIVIIGQAPGRLTHEAGVPWDDKSGERLRGWLGLDDQAFYNEDLLALMPMGFCYPGTGKSGDLPPRAECAPLWHDRILKALKQVELRIYIGRFAIDAYLPKKYKTITAAVEDWEALLPGAVVLPHPSGRNNIWLKKNPWFTDEVLPRVRERVKCLSGCSII
jgi:uracil-DNA glycosylase